MKFSYCLFFSSRDSLKYVVKCIVIAFLDGNSSFFFYLLLKEKVLLAIKSPQLQHFSLQFSQL